jgi:hypothetical protein
VVNYRLVESFAQVASLLERERVRFLLVRMGTGNLASPEGPVVRARYHDLFLPPDPENALRAWRCCDEAGLELWAAGEPLGAPLDLWLAEHVVAGRVLVRATDRRGLLVDLRLLVDGFEFEDLWPERRHWVIDGVEVLVAQAKPSASHPTRPGAIGLLLPPPPGLGPGSLDS